MRPWMTFYKVRGNTASLPRKNKVREMLEAICNDPEYVGSEMGFTYDGIFQLVPSQPGLWQFTFRNLPKTDKAYGATFYVPINSSCEDILKRAREVANKFRGITESEGKLTLSQAAKLLTLNEQDKQLKSKLREITPQAIETEWQKLEKRLNQEKLNERLHFWGVMLNAGDDNAMKILSDYNCQLDLGKLDQGNTQKMVMTKTDQDLYSHWNEISFNGP
jgi:hypothetical protein